MQPAFHFCSPSPLSAALEAETGYHLPRPGGDGTQTARLSHNPQRSGRVVNTRPAARTDAPQNSGNLDQIRARIDVRVGSACLYPRANPFAQRTDQAVASRPLSASFTDLLRCL